MCFWFLHRKLVFYAKNKPSDCSPSEANINFSRWPQGQKQLGAHKGTRRRTLFGSSLQTKAESAAGGCNTGGGRWPINIQGNHTACVLGMAGMPQPALQTRAGTWFTSIGVAVLAGLPAPQMTGICGSTSASVATMILL